MNERTLFYDMNFKHEEVVHFSKEPEVINPKQFECNKCGAKQMTEKNYKKHLKIVHGEHSDDSVTCDKCGKRFTNLRRCRQRISFLILQYQKK